MADDQFEVDLSYSLAGRVALVTGGAAGIGRAIATAFADKGARVAVVDINADAAQTAASQLVGDARGYACDVTDPAAVDAAIETIVADFGTLDIAVNSAGIVILAPAEELSADGWSKTLAVNLTGTFLVAQAAGRHMLRRGRGKIINMASQAASVALDQHAAYCASKFGVVGLTKVLASEWAGRGVTANTISPTVVLTELGKKAWAGAKGDAIKKLIPTGRFAYPEEIAACAVFLASSAADMINGADLVVDGGYTIQ